MKLSKIKPALSRTKNSVGESPSRSNLLSSARFQLGDNARDLLQSGKIVEVGEIICNDDPLNRDYKYRLGCSSAYRRERDLVPVDCRFDPREVKRTANFVALVSRYTRLRRAGRQYVGRCPFHAERTPSFYIDPRRKIYKCFGRCNAGGDIFDFIIRAEQCGFSDAVQVVAGVAPDSEPRSGSRFGGRVGGEAPLARVARSLHSPQSEREAVLERLDATERRLRAILAANEAAAMEFATACEPMDGDDSLLLVNKQVTGHE